MTPYRPTECDIEVSPVHRQAYVDLFDALLLEDALGARQAAHALASADTPYRRVLAATTYQYEQSWGETTVVPDIVTVAYALRASAYASAPVEASSMLLLAERAGITPRGLRRLLLPTHHVISREINHSGSVGLSEQDKNILRIRAYEALEDLGIATFMDKLYHRVLLRQLH